MIIQPMLGVRSFAKDEAYHIVKGGSVTRTLRTK